MGVPQEEVSWIMTISNYLWTRVGKGFQVECLVMVFWYQSTLK